MLLECNNCGAPLNVVDNATKVRCGYCRSMSDISAYRKVADAPPPNWTPPVQWMPKDESSLPHVALQFHPAKVVTGVISRVISFVAIGTLAMGGFIAWRVMHAVSDLGTEPASQITNAMAQVASAMASASQAAALAAGAQNQGPISCQGNDSVRVVGRTVSIPGGTLATAIDNCHLTLVACTLVGETGVSAQGNSQVTIQGGSITATGPAIVLGGNSGVDVSSATISGEPGVRASDNAQATFRASTLSARHVAILAKNNAKVDTKGSTVTGDVTGGRRVIR